MQQVKHICNVNIQQETSVGKVYLLCKLNDQGKLVGFDEGQ